MQQSLWVVPLVVGAGTGVAVLAGGEVPAAGAVGLVPRARGGWRVVEYLVLVAGLVLVLGGVGWLRAGAVGVGDSSRVEPVPQVTGQVPVSPEVPVPAPVDPAVEQQQPWIDDTTPHWKLR